MQYSGLQSIKNIERNLFEKNHTVFVSLNEAGDKKFIPRSRKYETQLLGRNASTLLHAHLFPTSDCSTDV